MFEPFSPVDRCTSLACITPTSLVLLAWGMAAEAVRVAIADTPSDRDVIQSWRDAWTSLAEGAVASLAETATAVAGLVAS
jgi:hypothetical protein